MINNYILREGIQTPFSNFKMQSFNGNPADGMTLFSSGGINGNPNTKKKLNFPKDYGIGFWKLLSQEPLSWGFNINSNQTEDISGENPELSTDVANAEMALQATEDGQKLGTDLTNVVNTGLEVLNKVETDKLQQTLTFNNLFNSSTEGYLKLHNLNAPDVDYKYQNFKFDTSFDFNKTPQQKFTEQIDPTNSAYNKLNLLITNDKIISDFNTTWDKNLNDSKQSLEKLGISVNGNPTSKTVSDITGYAGAAWGMALNLGVSTGNKTADSAIGTGLNGASLLLKGGSGDLYSTLGSTLGSFLGTSDNSVVRAGGLLLGQTGNIINTAKAINATTKAIKTGLMAADAGKIAQLSNFTNLAGIGVGIADTALFGNQTPSEYAGKKGGITQGLDTAYDAINAGIAFVPGIGTAAAAIMAANKFLGHGIKAMGGGTDGMTTTDAILGSSFFQATPLGAINGFGGKNTTAWTKDDDVYSKVGGSYVGSNALADETTPYAGKKFGLFSSGARKKWENKIQEGLRQEKILRQIGNESERNKTLQQTMTGVNSQALNNILNGGYENTITFKKGGIFEMFGDKLSRANRIIIETKKTIIIEPKEEEKEETKNVIPEGALHANLNHMDTDDITKKGIPVIDNEGKQQAEIERNEIIFRLEVTKLIENLKKDGSDEAAIKAGKLLTEEILHNTEDRTGLLEQFKQGGEILIAKSGTETEKKLTIDDIVDYDSFYNYLKQTERTEPNFDYKGFYENEDMRNDWIKREKENPGHAHMNDFYKLPTHFTYSKESKNGKDFGGEWLGNDLAGWMFKASPFNMSQHSFEEMKEYWDKNEPNSVLWYGTEFYKPVLKQELEEFKNGGTVNVIPEGNLHARLHHMENAEGLTKKGIPVVDNDGDQLAEIELNEIIFRLEITKKLEELSKKENKEEAALEAGKLLVDEILNNTDDRTGLIETIE